MDFSPSPESDNSGYYRNRNRRDCDRDRDRGVRGRSKDRYYRSRHSRSRSRSYSRERYISGNNRRSPERDLYRDLIDQDYGDNSYDNRDRYHQRNRDRDRRSRDRDRRDHREKSNKRNYSPVEHPVDFDDNFDSDSNQEFFYQQKPNNKIVVRGLAAHVTEADIYSDLIQCGLQALHVRLIRRKKTGASRGFAFVEFRTEEEATRWISYKQGMLMLDDHRAIMQYTYSLPAEMRSKPQTDWYCAKCGVFNFKRRENCFKCFASREESEKGGEGSDEISNILTKKIMLRNLDALTNEESVLCAMQEKIPELVSKISKILVCRDPLTQTSRGICYLHFDNLIDSMNSYNALKAVAPILKIDGREVLISYCIDAENRNLVKGNGKNPNNGSGFQDPNAAGGSSSAAAFAGSYQYTLADVPRLAEYSAAVYASNPTEHEHYLQFYTNYYMTQIAQGQMSNFPTEAQLGETANSGAAVAQSAMARKQGSKNKTDTSDSGLIAPPPPTITQPQPLEIPNGTDGKKYPQPDVTQYQYDETSGFYYDPTTGLYYDSNSQYYYNNETCSYLYWDNDNSTYVAAPTSSAAATGTTAPTADTEKDSDSTSSAANGKKEEKSKSKDQNQDKVKVAKKIVKDMEKWAKQLNQKKDYNVIQPPAKVEEATLYSSHGHISTRPAESSGGYADVGFSLLEKKPTQTVSNYLITQAKTNVSKAAGPVGNLVSTYGSDSDNEVDDGNACDRDYIDHEKLTCLLCKRGFQSMEILTKHIKMSALHKENLQKLQGSSGATGNMAKGLSYRDRAKERRLKYGEADPPPVNKSKERFQREMEKQTQAAFSAPNLANVPIGQNNVGNKLLQKMGWSEGQGLGRANQGRTNIIETEARVANAGLGTKATYHGASGDDYKTYIKKMMKSRYEQADMKD
ncbi:RNA-binding protein 5-B-like isoform X2 [Uranotaenia lowii]|uniref:RNA-binding protein 5-B-like isoform X2 n=1 Tax=Uranotaenia lowii TaxID=190385 RepID=UPI00247951B0|nr:RNA-binding protein 5-B-like isoform X2 [Uranotaenia lowii]